METIACHYIPPYASRPNVDILSRERPIEFTKRTSEQSQSLVYFTDASARNGRVSIAVVMKNASRAAANHSDILVVTRLPIRVFSDSQSALKSISNPCRQSGQALLHSICDHIELLQNAGLQVSLHWLPAHAGIELNELADREAKRLTEKNAADPPLSFTRAPWEELQF
jgi:hypothetical protein